MPTNAMEPVTVYTFLEIMALAVAFFFILWGTHIGFTRFLEMAMEQADKESEADEKDVA